MDPEVIKRYLKDECTPEERAEIKKLMLTGKAEALFEEALNEGWTKGPEGAEADDAVQLAHWNAKFEQKIDQQKNDVKTRKNISWLQIAAVLTIFVVGAYAYRWLQSGNAQTATIANFQETFTPNGKLLKIKLSDNSTITLNAGSKLKYPAVFNGKTREIYLDGEAFFDIAHDPAHPFIVHTSKITVSVLGTSFNIKSYQHEKNVSVAVATGKVGVLNNDNKHGNKAIMLLPGDKLAYDLIDLSVKQTKVDKNEVGLWQQGILIYHNETLENISRQLERWYDVKMVFKNDHLKRMRFNFKQKNDRLENVMQTLKFAGSIKYKISDRVVTIW